MTQATVPGYVYTVYTAEGCTVTAPGFPAFSVTCSPGMANSFPAPGDTVEISDPSATLVAVRTFNGALAALGLLGGGNTLSAGYTRLEYLEATGEQSIKTNGQFDQHTGLRLEAETFEGSGNTSCVSFMTQNPSAETYWWVFPPRANRENTSLWEWYWFKKFGSFTGFQLATRYIATINYRSGNKVTIEQNGTVAEKELPETLVYYSPELNVINSGWRGRCYSVHVSRNTALENNFVPALDETGAPCMFDLVTRTPFYNVGIGDFVTPPTGASTYSLRGRRVLPDWGKLTPTGLRRLYHVPDGYQGDMLQYAAEHGFCPIQEEPQPEEGFWAPKWEEVAGVIYLRWVATAPPEEI